MRIPVNRCVKPCAAGISRVRMRLPAVADTPEDALDALLNEKFRGTEVHRVVLPIVRGIARTHWPRTGQHLLRQSVHYCVKAEAWRSSEPSGLLSRMLDEHKLLSAKPGTRVAEDKWIEDLSMTIFTATPEQAAAAAAAALAEGMEPDAVGAAISLAANQLILRDHGRRPAGNHRQTDWGVHGDSIVVHVRLGERVAQSRPCVAPRNTFACLILGAYQAALDRTNRGGDFQNWEPLPLARHVNEVKSTEPEELLHDLDEAVRGNLQGRASGIVQRYGDLGHEPRGIFDLLRRYAISEDGALHAEKYFRTVTEEFNATRPAFRWRQLCALARVTASEYGRPPAWPRRKSSEA
jgi:hypothetical protein